MKPAQCGYQICALVFISVLPACASQQFNTIKLGQENRPANGRAAAHSWMLPEAKAIDLIYVEETHSVIYVYSYPKGKLEGMIDNFYSPRGECIDKAGDVFIPDYENRDILEYRHGETTPFKTYDNREFRPSDCSIDPKTGDLAVANWNSVSGSLQGTITLFKPPKTKPKDRITDVRMSGVAACTYDNGGNLYIVGWSGSLARFGLLHPHKNFILNVGLSPKINDPGDAHWDGKDLAISNNQNQIIRYAMLGKTGNKVGTTTLRADYSLDSFWLQPPYVIAGDSGQSGAFSLWKYPAGGSPVKTITGGYYVTGVVVSLANKSR